MMKRQPTYVRVLGVDPGLAHFGYALVSLGPETERVLSLGVIATKKSDKKRGMLQSDDTLRRAREVAEKFATLFPSAHSICAVCAESMSYPRSSSAAAKMAVSWGIIAAEVTRERLPLVQASPQELKQKLCGRKDASKEDVQAVLEARFGELASKILLPKGQHEHAFDALAAVVVGLDSDVIRLARRMCA